MAGRNYPRLPAWFDVAIHLPDQPTCWAEGVPDSAEDE